MSNIVAYIAGKITDEPNHKELFAKVEIKLIQDGWTVLNPCILPPTLPKHEDYMHICKAMIDVADAVFFLENWRDSKGAKIEFEYAMKKDKPRILKDMPMVFG